ncbi:MAG TPA: CoA pyrophosphatase [Candidatus Margulisiibacteriota bacterium]|nr:CoA pyrophosphatase [Candidatus Margulisiibacteriota bacterium]
MTIEYIRERLELHQPVVAEGAGYARAAVAIVLREGESGPEFIVIHRAHRRGDPWSGHMALPGGRQQAADGSVFATAARETLEEVGVDLERCGTPLGHLDDLRAIGRGRPLDLIITPVVCALHVPVTLTPNAHEVQSAFWVPLASLRRHEARGTYRHTIDGLELEHPAFVYEGHTIWGLTHRILTGFLDVLA